MILYHGSDKKLTSFSLEVGWRPESSCSMGPGVYLSSSPSIAKMYGTQVHKVLFEDSSPSNLLAEDERRFFPSLEDEDGEIDEKPYYVEQDYYIRAIAPSSPRFVEVLNDFSAEPSLQARVRDFYKRNKHVVKYFNHRELVMWLWTDVFGVANGAYLAKVLPYTGFYKIIAPSNDTPSLEYCIFKPEKLKILEILEGE